jgi:hypothetical protein
MRINPRVALIGLVALVVIGALWSGILDGRFLGATPAGGNQKSVTLVIDYGIESNRQVKAVDLINLPSDVKGWDLFKAANLLVQGTDQFPSGFVCRIKGWPKNSEQDCADTPTYSEGHWAYYVTNASVGSGWMLSGQGAAMHKPDCAGYEAWVWVSPGEESKPPRYEPKAQACQ